MARVMDARIGLTPEDRKILDATKRDRHRQERPAELAERARLIEEQASDDRTMLAENKKLAQELAAASRKADTVLVEFNAARNLVGVLWAKVHGASYGQAQRLADRDKRLRELSHPAVDFVHRALVQADFAVVAVAPRIAGVEDQYEEVRAPESEQQRQWWNRGIQGVQRIWRGRTVHNTVTTLTACTAAIRASRERVDALHRGALDDAAVLTRLRAELDGLLALPWPSSALNIRDEDLLEVRRKLDFDPTEWFVVDMERRDVIAIMPEVRR